MAATATRTQHLWFFDTLVRFPVSTDDGSDGISLMESAAPHGDSPPLHVHRSEDELFHVLEGELRFRVGGREERARAGESLLAPQGVPHTYRVESEGGARWLVVTTNGDFERFVRAFSRPAEGAWLPEPSGPHSPEQEERSSKRPTSTGSKSSGRHSTRRRRPSRSRLRRTPGTRPRAGMPGASARAPS